MLSAGERSLLCKMPAAERQEWLVRLWCSKEALAKAIGRGMVGGPRSFVTQRLEPSTGKVTLGVGGELVRRLPEQKDKAFSVYTGCEDGLVYATSVLD